MPDNRIFNNFTILLTILRLTRALERPSSVFSHSPVPVPIPTPAAGRGRSGKELSSQTSNIEVLDPLQDNQEPCIPLGDEPWVDADSGLVLELSPIDLKALDKIPRALYGKQLRYQHSLQLKSTEDVIRRILQVWSPESGLIGQANQNKFDVLSESVAQDGNPMKLNLVFGAVDERAGDRSLSMILKEPSVQLLLIMEEHKNGNVLHQISTEGEDNASKSALVGEMSKLPLRSVLTYSAYVSDVLPTVMSCFERKESQDDVKGLGMSNDNLSQNDGILSLPSLFVQKSSSTDSIDMIGTQMENLEIDKMYGDRIPAYGIFDILLEIDEDLKDIYMNMMALLPPPKVSTYEQ